MFSGICNIGEMSLSKNIRVIINRVVLADRRIGVRLYSDESNENEEQKPIDPTKDRSKIIPVEDEYLVLDPRNTKLLEQFISEYTGQVLDAFKTGLCQKKHKQLLVAIEQAWDQGYLTYDVPFREYDYSLYKSQITL
ncbi:uncharacterized protein LOC125056956 isoform X2 [Pieris napi]|uniref:uncharacterized protein LOC125056956 isoform X2 n=1 Tax=Pieris napi TaxID=78633 RepID=UPI001FBB9055|nr:uncharacterized protein LOC125056956 isoform X2 [Pieris napi]